ncbi:MAG: DUF2279 domain-containing protein [Flavobacteriales bacterium]
MVRLILFSFLLTFFSRISPLTAQTIRNEGQDTLNNPSKLLIPALALAYTAGMYGLYHAWYKDYDTGSFRLFNDNAEWLQMDKLGHLTTSWYLGLVGYEAFKLANHPEKRAIWLGGSMGSIFLTGVEIFDGFSEGWGFSIGDAFANFSGSALFISQQLIWKSQRISLKYSYAHSPYAQVRPELLGSGMLSRALKDYNGQRYWLSVNPASFFSNDVWIPSFLNIAVGHGASGMLGGHDNIWFINGQLFDYSQITRYRQWYLSFDIDLTKLKTQNKWMRMLLSSFGFIKFPAPAIQYDRMTGFRFRPLMF